MFIILDSNLLVYSIQYFIKVALLKKTILGQTSKKLDEIQVVFDLRTP